ncbi:CTD kinase subunit gamma CTK3-domain-containing protein [Syncephalastrum racemosum]|uniref:CTD kinase subunit gamma CTK3-domain-containing protein n=1 Tax=Syncephalastrum racemosum TaxID=13706 RepID=A0A1X2HHI0_SYNRA|nr:CTD kinase subunit gamma CTK3-domain-containing protein [Syncephalastrum racemosum]
MTDSDPFECRLTFLSLLEKLNASQQSIHKVATYAVRHRQLSEDLYSCLLEELEQASINARLNIIYVLDAIFAASQKVHYSGYNDLTRRDLPRILAAVVPDDPKGLVNIANTRKILNNWRRREYFNSTEIDKAEKPLLEKESRTRPLKRPRDDDASGFTKDDILRRMEEDRERHKRFREEIWIRPVDEKPEAEFEQLWDRVDALNPDDDYELMMKQNMLRLPHYPWSTLFLDRNNNSTTQADAENALRTSQDMAIETPGDETDDMSIDPEDDSNYQLDAITDNSGNNLKSPNDNEMTGTSGSSADNAKLTATT